MQTLIRGIKSCDLDTSRSIFDNKGSIIEENISKERAEEISMLISEAGGRVQ